MGNTTNQFSTWTRRPVHPHACGEHFLNPIRVINLCGSSPRLWGTRSALSARAQVLRFIPTPVGNTPDRLGMPHKKTVHPHACGEHSCGLCPSPVSGGSSPRLWGTQRDCIRVRSCSPVHPHACGEHGLLCSMNFVIQRFIPTPVGNTALHRSCACRSSVHPHACGEHNNAILSIPRGFSVHPHACGEHTFQESRI